MHFHYNYLNIQNHLVLHLELALNQIVSRKSQSKANDRISQTKTQKVNKDG
jgi:hypothetical protein